MIDRTCQKNLHLRAHVAEKYMTESPRVSAKDIPTTITQFLKKNGPPESN